MAIEIKAIPVLEGRKASAFIKKVEEESRNKVSSEKIDRIRIASKAILAKAKF